ncbi:MAG: M3 family metallopeptidase [Alphaproteobacteria bacterium]|nr:M3 family metallopeptidase [Alphaproteobacteria bacterium]
MPSALPVSIPFDAQNPLMNPPALPHGAPPLDVVNNAHILPALRWGITKAKESIEAIKTNTSPANFENVIEALEFAGEDLTRISAIFHNLCSSKNSDELRAIEEIADVELSNYHSDISLDECLFTRVKEAYAACREKSLSGEQRMLLEECYKSFVRSGALLSADDKIKMRALNKKLSQISTQFGNNTVKATEAYKKTITTPCELAGVPKRALDLYKYLADEAGQPGTYLITLEPYPIDIFTHGQNRSLREEIHRAYATRCFKDAYNNLELITEMVRLKHQRANLLGYATYADFVLENRMAGNVKTVSDFLETNLATYKPAAEKELAAIRAIALEMDGINELKPWDVAYYARILKERTYNLELETLRPYFDLEKVLEGVQRHTEKLFGIELREETTGRYPTYHSDVKAYEVFDTDTHTLIGLFYADYYARPGAKRSGAWMSTFRDRSVTEGEINIPIVINNCNFPKPTPTRPTFLSLGDVETVFHEFGHALHALLATAQYSSLAGPNVKWDFVELPSQVQERWIIQKEVLDTFARHHKTGELIPTDLVKTIQAMQNFDAGLLGLTQTFYGLLDMAYFSGTPSAIQDPETLETRIAERATLIKREAGLMSTTFHHIFGGGYGAGYYSYKWAEVLDADVFSAFKKKGLYDPDLCKRLRQLYAKGGTEPPMDIYVEMMGRKPDPNALFRLSGLLPDRE